jgi:hypothetical protein
MNSVVDKILKLPLKYKVAIAVVLIHFAWVLLAFHRDTYISLHPDDFCILENRNLNMPLSWLAISDFYFFPLPFLFPFAYPFFNIDGTGGPCTFVTINSAFPYSFIFIIISSFVYFLPGLFIGIKIENFRKKRITKSIN